MSSLKPLTAAEVERIKNRIPSTYDVLALIATLEEAVEALVHADDECIADLSDDCKHCKKYKFLAQC